MGDSSTYTLSPLGVRLMGAALILGGLALPGVWWKRFRPAKPPVTHISALRPEMRRVPIGTLTESPEKNEILRLVSLPDEVKTAFAISVTEVTQGQYEQVMGKNPSHFQGDPERPVESVSFLDALVYCNRLSEIEGLPPCYQIDGKKIIWSDGLSCRGYRLPTEAEWLYAARADARTKYAGSDVLDEVAWSFGNAKLTTHPVAGKRANAWGLYDFSGNVSEWLWDFYTKGITIRDFVDPKPFVSRIYVGGSWADDAKNMGLSTPERGDPDRGNPALGFRIARSVQ